VNGSKKWVNYGRKLCISDFGKFKRGDHCYFYEKTKDDFFIGIDRDDNFEAYPIDYPNFKKHFGGKVVSLYLDLNSEIMHKRLFFKPKIKNKIVRREFSFYSFDDLSLKRVQSEIFPYILEIKDKELLIQFSSDIAYTLSSLIDLYNQRYEIDYGLEITKASKIFKEINSYCIPMQEKSNESVRLYKNEKLRDVMTDHNFLIDSTLAKLKELNKCQ